MRPKLLVSALAMAGGFSFALLSHEHHAAAKVPAAAPAPAPVAVATAQAGDVPIELDGLGRVQAFNTVTVRTQVEGQIQHIAFAQGQTVHKGDLLVKIDPRLYQAKLEQDQATLARDQAHLANAVANLNRYLPLAHSGFASGQQVDTQQAMVAQQKATLKADQALIDQDQVELDYTNITAPLDGVAGFRLVDQGNVVHPTDANGLVTITEVQPIAVLFTLPQADLPAIQQHMAAAGQAGLTVDAYSEDGRRKLDQGTLETTSNMVDAASGTITLRADFPNARKLLWPGEFLQARLVLSVRHDGVTVPAAVVQRGPTGSYAWVVAPSGTAVMQPITVAQLAHDRALVTSGLAPGQKVVTDGQYGLQPGTRVAEQTSSAAADAAPLKNAQTDMLGIQP